MKYTKLVQMLVVVVGSMLLSQYAYSQTAKADVIESTSAISPKKIGSEQWSPSGSWCSQQDSSSTKYKITFSTDAKTKLSAEKIEGDKATTWFTNCILKLDPTNYTYTSSSTEVCDVTVRFAPNDSSHVSFTSHGINKEMSKC